ncbi:MULTISPECIES: hypothetical protein [unclassified Streptomyces]|uniref:hypothetical protein n=1 Tax=unclassified Streptomyces TaxID=2593676 RepID=UPI000B87BDEF|nr:MULTISPECIES: hypothetical protein [unclassified Streptomyces]MYQ84380.1 hypothetical protein [Streptomyces sp. SID4936]
MTQGAFSDLSSSGPRHRFALTTRSRRGRKTVGEPVLFSRPADRTEHNAFVGNLLAPLHKTSGR